MNHPSIQELDDWSLTDKEPDKIRDAQMTLTAEISEGIATFDLSFSEPVANRAFGESMRHSKYDISSTGTFRYIL